MARDISKTGDDRKGKAVSSSDDVAQFLAKASKLGHRPGGNGGLIFALDATMSRQHTWDQAQQIQASMFDAVGKTGGLDIQLVYFRGFGECRALQ